MFGGGNSCTEHIDGIKEYIAKEKNIALVFATARQAKSYQDIKVPIFFTLVGNEGRRLIANVGAANYHGTCVLPPYPRTMGTEVPAYAEEHTVELKEIAFTNPFKDSVTTIALQLALNLTDGDIFVVGYDGYPANFIPEKEMDLTNENKTIFRAYEEARGKKLQSLTPSLYKDLELVSLYQFI